MMPASILDFDQIARLSACCGLAIDTARHTVQTCDHVDWVRYLITPAICVRPSINRMSPGLIKACSAFGSAGVNGS